MTRTYALNRSHGTWDPHPPNLGLCVGSEDSLIVFAVACPEGSGILTQGEGPRGAKRGG